MTRIKGDNVKKLIKSAIIAVMIMMTGICEAEEINAAHNIEVATQVIKQNPTGLNYLLRANIYFNNVQYKEAIEDCNKALELGCKSEQVYEIRALSYINIDKYEEAIADCNYLLQENPKSVNAYKIRGGAYILLNDYEKALADFNAALKLSPEDEDIKKSIEGIKDIQAAEKEDPQAREKDFLMTGLRFFKDKQFDKSIMAFNKVLELNSQNTLAYKLRGAAYMETGKVDKAIEDWEKASQLDPNDNQLKDFLSKAREIKNAQSK